MQQSRTLVHKPQMHIQLLKFVWMVTSLHTVGSTCPCPGDISASGLPHCVTYRLAHTHKYWHCFSLHVGTLTKPTLKAKGMTIAPNLLLRNCDFCFFLHALANWIVKCWRETLCICLGGGKWSQRRQWWPGHWEHRADGHLH